MAKEKQETIYELIPKVAESIGVIDKSLKNQAQGYKYRGIEPVMNACHPAFIKHGIFCTPEVLSCLNEQMETNRGGKMAVRIVTVKYTFFAPDGSNVSCVVQAEGMDSGDKASNKAMSAAFKYAVGQVFAIPFEVVDSETDSPTTGNKMASAAQLKQVSLEMKTNGLTTAAEIIGKCGEIIGRNISEGKDMTAVEADAVISACKLERTNK